jgi:hypothetical protein
MLHEVWFSDLAFSHSKQIKWNLLKCRFFNSAMATRSEYNDEGEGEDDTSMDLNQMQINDSQFTQEAKPHSCHNVWAKLYKLPDIIYVFSVRWPLPSPTDRMRRLLITGI